MRRMSRVQAGALPAPDQSLGREGIQLVVYRGNRSLVDALFAVGDLEESVSVSRLASLSPLEMTRFTLTLPS